MPRADWGIAPGVVRDFDRDSQYRPYDGPTPINGVYQFQVKFAKFIAPTDTKLPQLRIGLELVPRNQDEKKYAGFFIQLFRSISDRSAMFWVPFLDAIGVTETEFRTKTIYDSEGNIKSIGKWRSNGQTQIKAELKDETDQNGQPRKAIGWMGAADAIEVDDEDYDDEEYEDEEVFAKEYDDDEEWE